MSDSLKQTVRLKKTEAADLREKAFSLTKQAINEGHKKVFQESDIVHFLLEEVIKHITIDKNGNLAIDEIDGQKK